LQNNTLSQNSPQNFHQSWLEILAYLYNKAAIWAYGDPVCCAESARGADFAASFQADCHYASLLKTQQLFGATKSGYRSGATKRLSYI
jgi:hypothetical protein